MLHGYRGHLIAQAFLERHLAATAGAAIVPDALQHRLREWHRRSQTLGPASSLRTMLEIGAEPLVRLLGFGGIDRPEAAGTAIVATLPAMPPLLLVVANWGARLDPMWPIAMVHARRRSTRWSVLFNGTHLRLVDARRLSSRRFLEFDLELATEDGESLRAAWTILRPEALEDAGADQPSLVGRLVEASERHGSDVCRSLRDGVREASVEILGQLARARRRRSPTDAAPDRALDEAYAQALTIVYRILFLLFAEARLLVPIWHPLYREAYSLEQLRMAAECRKVRGLWDALKAACRLAHDGCRAGDLRVTAFNGRLFSPSGTPLLDRTDLDDESARRALLAICTRPTPDRAGREPIAYRDLDVEQLGAVYETLLDYAPSRVGPAEPPARARAPEERQGPADGQVPERRSGPGVSVTLRPGTGRRKATGTFYTPRPLTRFLVRRALAPLVRDASPEDILSLRVLDPAMGSGAFLVGACRYLLEAYEAALVRDGRCHSSDLGPREREAARRLIAERCLYGVDVNPMAVQLARLSLWLASLAADRPLGFLDHHLAVGDSLVGVWLSCLRHPPDRRGSTAARRELPLFDVPARDALRQALPVRFTLASMPTETAAQVREKERALATLNRREATLSRWRRVADLWCTGWFSDDRSISGRIFAALSDRILTGASALPDQMTAPPLAHAETVAAERRYFHWELEFPEVFFDRSGARLASAGFDAVVGNPPWDMLRADAGEPADRIRSRAEVAALGHFVRDSGIYSVPPDGHVNRYQLFLERALALTRPGGRFGLVLPSGAITDHGSAPLRRLLWSRGGVDALVGFENRRGVFPVHRSLRFLLMTGTAGAPTTDIGCRFGEHDPAVLDAIEGADEESSSAWFPVRVTPSLLERLGGADSPVPDLRTPLDLAIAERAASRFPALGAAEGWGARFGRDLNATDDRRLFGPPGAGLPLVEGKLIEPFRVDLQRARWSVRRVDAIERFGTRLDRARIAYREVAAATNRRTLIAAVLPAGCVSTHTVSCLQVALPSSAQHLLCGLFNSLVLNYLVRLRVTTHVTTLIVERLPVPRPETAPASCRRIAALARHLARAPDADAAAHLDACVARLYGLTGEEFSHVVGTFPLVPLEERAAALRAYKEIG
jgi:hypothetical protein